MTLETTLSPEEMKFFETGELQPGMAPAPAPEVPVVEQQAHATPPVPDPAAASTPPNLAVQSEVADLLRNQLLDAQNRTEELQRQLAQLQESSKAPPVAPPDPNTDPLGAMMHQLENVNKTVADLQAAIATQRAQSDEASKFQRFQSDVLRLRDDFIKTTPDFPAAYDHLRNARISDLRAFGFTDDKIQQILFQEEVTLSQQAMKLQRNPAQAVYDMAKRHGYTPKPAAGTPATPDAKLTSIQQAQAAAKPLPSTPQLEDVTIEGLKAASDADLTKLVHDPKMWAKITGADQYPL